MPQGPSPLPAANVQYIDPCCSLHESFAKAGHHGSVAEFLEACKLHDDAHFDGMVCVFAAKSCLDRASKWYRCGPPAPPFTTEHL